MGRRARRFITGIRRGTWEVTGTTGWWCMERGISTRLGPRIDMWRGPRRMGMTRGITGIQIITDSDLERLRAGEISGLGMGRSMMGMGGAGLGMVDIGRRR